MAQVAWFGGAPAVPQITTFTLVGSGSGVTHILRLDSGAELSITFLAEPTNDQMGNGLADAINGNSIQDNVSYRSGTGKTVGEFSMISAVYATNVLTVTGASDGRPFTLTIDTALADNTGTLVQTETGPNHFSQVLNWEGGALPVADDELIFDSRAVSSLLYDMDKSAVAYDFTCNLGFRHEIGLDPVNQTNNGLSFAEPLPTYLQIDNRVGGSAVRIGEGSGPGSKRIRLDVGGQATINIAGSGPRSQRNTPAIHLICGASSTLGISGGDAAVGYNAGETSTLSTVTVNGDSTRLVIGEACALAALTMDGGTVDCHDLPTGAISVNGGVFVCHFTGAAAGIAVGANSVADFSQDGRSRTFTNVSLYASSSWLDPLGTISSALELHHCEPGDLKQLDLPKHRKYTIAAI